MNIMNNSNAKQAFSAKIPRGSLSAATREMNRLNNLGVPTKLLEEEGNHFILTGKDLLKYVKVFAKATKIEGKGGSKINKMFNEHEAKRVKERFMEQLV